MGLNDSDYSSDDDLSTGYDSDTDDWSIKKCPIKTVPVGLVGYQLYNNLEINEDVKNSIKIGYGCAKDWMKEFILTAPQLQDLIKINIEEY